MMTSPVPQPESHLLVDLDPTDVGATLVDWQGVLPEASQPLYMTAAGDVVLVDAHGQVLLLDTGAGSLDVLADSVDAYERGLADADNLAAWFAANVVEQLIERDAALAPGQCYGYATLPVFAEGSYGPDNRRVVDALEHLSFTADVHRQIRDLPDGAQVRLEVRE